MAHARVRRAVVLFLAILTLVVFLRAIAGARGAPAAPPPSMRLEEATRLVAAPGILRRTLALVAPRAARDPIDVEWGVGGPAGTSWEGSATLRPRPGSTEHLVLSVPVPPVEAPQGLDLTVRARDGERVLGEETFPFTIYPDAPARHLADLFGRARVGLFDPEGTAAGPLRSLGLSVEIFSDFQALALYAGDLVVVGPSGFGRDREALGPILAARARGGMPILFLEQSTFPGTLSEDLRLWPSFSRGPETSVLLAAGHPVVDGLPGDRGARYLERATAGLRPFLPPSRGNFSMVAALRDGDGPAGQEGAAILEYRIDRGTILGVQAPLCADFDRDARARILLANSLAYLLGGRLPLKRACLLAAPGDAPPECIARLAPFAPEAPADLDGVDLLLVPADWEALRARAKGAFPPLATVARYLRQGGTVVLLDPQVLVLDDISAMIGAPVYFDASGRAPGRGVGSAAARTSAGTIDAGPAATMLQGIASDDLALLASDGRPELRLRAAPGPEGIEPQFLAPGLACYRVGRGTLVALALPDRSTCDSPPVAALVARLLTNLGIPLDARPGIDPQAITRLDDPADR